MTASFAVSLSPMPIAGIDPDAAPRRRPSILREAGTTP